jgi:predicted RNA-binding Zn-ribbon protein involved in translation (DUF1610 family)
MAPESHTDDRRTDRTDDDSGRTTPVDGEIIHDTARRYNFGAGRLKAALEGLGPSGDLETKSLEDLDDKLAEAAGAALHQHGEQQADAVRDEWKGETVYSTEFECPVDVERVYDPLPDSVLRNVQGVEIEKPNGHLETTSLDTLNHYTSGPAVAVSAQAVTCGACHRDVTADTVTDTETGRSYWTCPECGEANVDGRNDDD